MINSHNVTRATTGNTANWRRFLLLLNNCYQVRSPMDGNCHKKRMS